MNSDLSVIIPTYNNTKGLQYLLDYFKDKNYQIIVVDNKTSKEKKDFIVSLFHCYEDRLSYLPQERNLGFAGSINLGSKYVKTKWMLILNDDVEFPTSLFELRGAGESQKAKVKSSSFAEASEDKQKLNSKVKSYQFNILEELMKEAEKRNLDAVSPVLRNPNGKIENLGYRVLSYGRISLFKDLASLRVSELDGITAACLLIKTSVFKKLGGFDESFFAYLEDVDLFLRMRRLDPRLRGDDTEGRRNDRLPFGIAYDIEVLHNHMTTAKTMGNFKARQDMINWWRLFFKHPDRFKFNLDFILERLRNISGYLKATFK